MDVVAGSSLMPHFLCRLFLLVRSVFRKLLTDLLKLIKCACCFQPPGRCRVWANSIYIRVVKYIHPFPLKQTNKNPLLMGNVPSK